MAKQLLNRIELLEFEAENVRLVKVSAFEGEGSTSLTRSTCRGFRIHGRVTIPAFAAYEQEDVDPGLADSALAGLQLGAQTCYRETWKTADN